MNSDKSSVPLNPMLVSDEEHAAVVRLIGIVNGGSLDSERVEKILRALFDKQEPPQALCVPDVWPISNSVIADVCKVFEFVAYRRCYLVSTEYGSTLARMLRRSEPSR